MAMQRRLSWCALPAGLVFLIGLSDALPDAYAGHADAVDDWRPH
jgi:hypothetical protein